MPALKKQNEKEKRKKEEEGREGKKEEAETVEVTLGGEANQDGDRREGEDKASFPSPPGLVSKTAIQQITRLPLVAGKRFSCFFFFLSMRCFEEGSSIL